MVFKLAVSEILCLQLKMSLLPLIFPLMQQLQDTISIETCRHWSLGSRHRHSTMLQVVKGKALLPWEKVNNLS